jgi:hypothetical protein
MMRTQILLSDADHRWLKKWAQKLGISMAEAVRRCIRAHLERVNAASGREERIRAALAVCGKYRDPDPSAPLADDHDRYLAEVYLKR